MAENRTEKAPKKNFFQGLKSEFKKIIWADKVTLTKQTILVVVISLVMGVIITVVDSVALQLVNLIMK